MCQKRRDGRDIEQSRAGLHEAALVAQPGELVGHRGTAERLHEAQQCLQLHRDPLGFAQTLAAQQLRQQSPDACLVALHDGDAQLPAELGMARA